MTSAKPADDIGAIPVEPPFYLWKFQGMAVQVRIRLDVIRRIREYLFDSVPQPSEAGGLLIGKSDGLRTEITDFAPIFRDSKSGPHFVLSDSEKTDLRGYIEGLNQADPTSSVLGYFRSDFRDGVRLTDDDQQLIQNAFSDPRSVFLVVQSRPPGPPSAGFFFWESGIVFGSFSFMEFDFDETVLASESYAQQPEVTPAVEDDVPEEPVAVVTPIALAGLPRTEPLVPRWAIPALGGVLLVGAGAYYGFKMGNPAPGPAPASADVKAAPREVFGSGRLGLGVASSGKDFSITWDARSPLVTGAKVALLTIDDGPVRRDISLTKVQLLSSRLVYTPTTSEIRVALEAFGEDGNVTRENVIAMAQPGPAPVTTARFETRVDTSSAASASAPDTESRDRKAVREFVPPAARAVPEPATPAPPSLELPKVATTKLDLQQNGLPPQSSAPPPLRADAPRPGSVVSTQPIQVLAQAVRRSAVPLRQVRPVLPDNVKAMLSSRTSVKVRLQIDATGRVTGVEPLVSGGSLNRLLVAAAASAARDWVFEPATEAGKKVPSELTVEFAFVSDER